MLQIQIQSIRVHPMGARFPKSRAILFNKHNIFNINPPDTVWIFINSCRFIIQICLKHTLRSSLQFVFGRLCLIGT